MNRFAPYASLAIVLLVTGCGGFTTIGEGAAGMGNAAGMEAGGSTAMGGSAGSAGTKGSTGGTGMGTGGTGMSTGGTGTGTGGTGMETGGTGMGGTSGGYEPCSQKACGATCTLCDPSDKKCVEDQVVKYCDATGGCGLNFPDCGGTTDCKSAMDCPQPAIACSGCTDGNSACPTTDCIMGKCVTTFPTCPAPQCMSDDDCPVSDAPCQMCADGTTVCPWASCDGGKCTAGIDSCDVDPPCKGKSCGDPCTTCTADLPCVNIAMTCDENLQCQFNQPMCSAPQCKENADCNTDVCGLCASTGGCADQVCVEGKCTFSCPPPKMDLCGGCLVDEVCVNQSGGPPGASYHGYHCDKPSGVCDSVDPCACLADEGTCTYHSDGGGYCACDNGLD